MIQELFQKYGLSLSSPQEKKLKKFLEIFLETNQHLNLSAIREPTDIIEKHFIDSILLLNTPLAPKKNAKILDFGTGGGFPGIPLKICFLDCEMILLDSIGKKVRVLNTFCEKLNLQNIYAIQERGENFHTHPFEKRFDIILARSVAHLQKLISWSHHLLTTNGRYVFYKLSDSKEINESQKTLKKYQFFISKTWEYTLAGTKRVYIEIKRK